jgi:cytidylate kinase
MIIAIDGPAGAGKSTVARRVAEELGFRFLDTGATYRATALAALRRGIAWENPEAMAAMAKELRLELDGSRVLLDGEDISDAIRTQEVTDLTRFAADNAAVREVLVEVQRRMAGTNDVVTEGRDQGTVVFPDARYKFFLTASPEERARRRVAQMREQGRPADYREILRSQEARDRRDACREVGPLRKPEDAIEIVTDGLTEEEVVGRIIREVRKNERFL